MNNPRIFATLVLILLTLTQLETVMASPGDWARYPIGTSGFSGEFPSEPQLETKSVEGVPGKIYIGFSRDEEMNVYGAMFMDDLGVNTEKLTPPQLADFYKGTAAGFKQGVLKTLGTMDSTFEVKETGEREVSFAGPAGNERDYTVGPAKVTVRMAVRGRSLFMGFVTIALEGPENRSEKFFGSFHVSKVPAKSPAMRAEPGVDRRGLHLVE